MASAASNERVVTKAEAAAWGSPIISNMKLTGLTQSVIVTDVIAREIIRVYSEQFGYRDEMEVILSKKMRFIQAFEMDTTTPAKDKEDKTVAFTEETDRAMEAIKMRAASWEQRFDDVQKKHYVRCDFVDRNDFLRARSTGEY